MLSPVVSIVVPVYNTPYKMFETCVDSLINQSYNNIEIIIVDDGSSEDIAHEIDDIALKDSRLKVFHRINNGVSQARNFGMRQSTGEYVTFVDSDDCINKFWLKEAVALAEKNSADIVYGCVVMCKTSPENQKIDNPGYVIVEKEELWKIQGALLTGNFPEFKSIKHFDLGPYAKLFRKKSIDDNAFPTNVRISEDQVFNHAVLNKTERCVVMDCAAYYYIYNANSVSHSFQPDAVDIIEKAMLLIGQYITDQKNINKYYYRVIDDMLNAIQLAYFFDGDKKNRFSEKVSGVNYAKSKPILSEALRKIKLNEISARSWRFKVRLLKYSTFLFVITKMAYNFVRKIV